MLVAIIFPIDSALKRYTYLETEIDNFNMYKSQ